MWSVATLIAAAFLAQVTPPVRNAANNSKSVIYIQLNIEASANTTVNLYRSPTGCFGTFAQLVSGLPANGTYTDISVETGTVYGYQFKKLTNGVLSSASPCVAASAATGAINHPLVLR